MKILFRLLLALSESVKVSIDRYRVRL